MADFLLELLSEEIPARMQDKARADLARLFAAEMHARSEFVDLDPITYATPRRLVLISRNLPEETAAIREEIKGPRTSAPEQALEGFLRKNGLSRDQLNEQNGIWFATIEKPGRLMKDVLAEAIPAIFRAFPWPKSMRWGEASLSTESPRWVRPLHGIVALLGEEIVDFEIAGIRSGAATLGHRFHHPGPITIGGAHDYVEKLRACHVIVDQEERKELIRQGAAKAAADAGLALVEDEGLIAENAGLTEWPVPLLGAFDPAFLDVPREVIQLTLRTNQKYFVLTGKAGELAPHFLCVANIDAADGGARIVEGNRKVLAARLADARFFWEQDLKIPLEEQAGKLSQIVFHEKLGTVADKVARVAKLARWLIEEGIVKSSPSLLGEGDHAQHGGGARSEAVGSAAGPSTTGFAGGPPPRAKLGEDREELAALAERAARLAKADLVTGLVGEFPELQGIIGGHLARAQGEPDEVADAIRDHYKPVGQGDEVPTAPVTVAVSLADKLDTIISFFCIDERPTGSKDPYAIRRAALGVVALVLEHRLRLPLFVVGFNALSGLGETALALSDQLTSDATHQQVALKDFQKLMEAGLGSSSIIDVKLPELTAVDAQDSTAMQLLLSLRTKMAKGPKLFLDEISDFFADRLKVQQREAGVRHDLIDAVFALGGEDDLVRLLARVKALQAFVETGEGADLLAGYKRAANILKKEGWPPQDRHPELVSGSMPPDGGEVAEWMLKQVQHDGDRESEEQSRNETLSYTPEKEETALIAALDSAEPAARAAVEAEDFEAAMRALALLRAPVDAFFDKVTVNDADRDKRAARLDLLLRMRDAVHRVADFSKIEG
jgi:glycyl-tRNA synthetase beta chain